LVQALWRSFKRVVGNTPRVRKIWLFYASPESWLDESGERHFAESVFWSSERGTRAGDLALLYRISLDRIKVDQMVSHLGMTRELAERIKGSELGKDIPLIWKVNSVRSWCLPRWWPWAAGCEVERLHWFDPPITLAELKEVSQLRRSWRDLNRNFQATGRSALEIPTEAWRYLSEILRVRGFSDPGDSQSRCGVGSSNDVES
jgi:hypothetical protein